MKITPTSITEVKLIQPRIYHDDRGFFVETFEQQRYQQLLRIQDNFVQDNHSCSYKNVLRGLHLQYRHGQGKLIRVVRGEIFDVAVDLRPNSLSYGRWTGAILNEDNQHQMWIPTGFAHGFVVLSDIADVSYKCTDYYHPEFEICIQWNDPDLNIQWPIDKPILSSKDQQGISFKEAKQFLMKVKHLTP